jgi:hypothetical protein
LVSSAVRHHRDNFLFPRLCLNLREFWGNKGPVASDAVTVPLATNRRESETDAVRRHFHHHQHCNPQWSAKSMMAAVQIRAASTLVPLAPVSQFPLECLQQARVVGGRVLLERGSHLQFFTCQQEDLDQALCKCNSGKAISKTSRSQPYVWTRLNENLATGRTLRKIRRNKVKTCRNTYHA